MIAAPAKFYAYAVVDLTVSPPTLVAVGTTRQLARKAMDALPQPATLRVRRCKLTLFET